MRHLERFLAGIPIFLAGAVVIVIIGYIVLYQPVLAGIITTIAVIYYLGKKYESY